MSNIVLKKAEVIITINSDKRLEFENVQLINFPFTIPNDANNSNLSIQYSDTGKDFAQKEKLAETNKTPLSYSNPTGFNLNQIIVKNLEPGFNPLQITLIGKNYDTGFSTNSINFFPNFNMNIDKDLNRLNLTNIISIITSNNTNVTSQFTRNPNKSHVIGKIIILYDMGYNNSL